MSPRVLRADCVIVGAGMAGTLCALTVAQRGGSAIMLEATSAPGGSAALSGGLVWTDPDYRTLRARIPDGDPELGRVLVEDFQDGVDWLRAQGVEMTDRLTGLFGSGEGHRIQDMPAALERLREQFEELGGTVICDAGVTALRVDADGRVCGVTATGDLSVDARAVVLCTGGFQGDRELVAEHLGVNLDELVLRANPRSTGDGLRLALSAGGRPSAGMSSFYGHLLPAPPARITAADFTRLSQYYSIHCVLLNREGRRFVDESVGDEVSTQALARQPGAQGFLVLDAGAVERVTEPVAAGFPSVDRFTELAVAGGRTLQADDLSHLDQALDAAGADGAAGRLEVERYNASMRSGRDLEVPRRALRRALDQPPFTIVPVVPGITFTQGGIKVDVDARVLRADGQAVPGLYAAGVDIGNAYFERYAGGLALGVVYGRRAAAHALAAPAVEV